MAGSLITGKIIGAAIEVHRSLGPGLLESAYDQCLCRELSIRGIVFEHQKALNLDYKGIHIGCAYRLDLLVDRTVVVEVKSVVALEPIHEAQLLTYMRLGEWPIGLLINFNVGVLRQGLKRMVLTDRAEG